MISAPDTLHTNRTTGLTLGLEADGGFALRFQSELPCHEEGSGGEYSILWSLLPSRVSCFFSATAVLREFYILPRAPSQFSPAKASIQIRATFEIPP